MRPDVFAEVVTQGETFHLELEFKDSARIPDPSIKGAMKRVKVIGSIYGNEVAVLDGDEDHIVIMRAPGGSTEAWPVGVHDLQLWADWGSSAALTGVQHELLLTIRLTVREAGDE